MNNLSGRGREGWIIFSIHSPSNTGPAMAVVTSQPIVVTSFPKMWLTPYHVPGTGKTYNARVWFPQEKKLLWHLLGHSIFPPPYSSILRGLASHLSQSLSQQPHALATHRHSCGVLINFPTFSWRSRREASTKEKRNLNSFQEQYTFYKTLLLVNGWSWKSSC